MGMFQQSLHTLARKFPQLSGFYYIRSVQKRYRNFPSVCINVLRKNYPFTAITKDDIRIKIENLHDLVWLSYGDVYKYCTINGNLLTVKKDGMFVKFGGWRHNGDIFSVFVKESYRSLPVNNSIVVDIGANIGDSAIYFALKGAKKIIALEPVLANYEIAKKNIELNKLQNVELILAGCSGKSGNKRIDPNKASNGSLTESETGIDVRMMSLSDIVSAYKIESGVLKVDCEGCEYDIIMSSDSDTLRKFNYIFGELHTKLDKMNQMKTKLETIGFSVRFVDISWTTGLPEYIEATRKQC